MGPRVIWKNAVAATCNCYSCYTLSFVYCMLTCPVTLFHCYRVTAVIALFQWISYLEVKPKRTVAPTFDGFKLNFWFLKSPYTTTTSFELLFLCLAFRQFGLRSEAMEWGGWSYKVSYNCSVCSWCQIWESWSLLLTSQLISWLFSICDGTE